MDNKQTPTNTHDRKPYSVPVLRNHGRITQLTTGGSTMNGEMANGNPSTKLV